jgi:hypothetical protein
VLKMGYNGNIDGMQMSLERSVIIMIFGYIFGDI